MEKYTSVELEVIKFASEDVIATSCTSNDVSCGPWDLGCVQD